MLLVFNVKIFILFICEIKIFLNDCKMDRNVDWEQNRMFHIAKDKYMCINDKDVTLDYIVLFKSPLYQRSLLDELTCVRDNQKVCFRMFYFFDYLVFSKKGTTTTTPTTTKQFMIHQDLFDSALINDIQGNYIFYKHDIVCFRMSDSDKNGIQQLQTTHPAIQYYMLIGNTQTCLVFNHDKPISAELTIGGRSVSISANVYSIEMSPAAQSLPECGSDVTFADETVVAKTLNVLDGEKTKFCVDKNNHVLDVIMRKETAQPNTKIASYCKKIERNKFCMKVGDDFKYATFHSIGNIERLLMMSRETGTDSFYFNDATTAKDVVLGNIGCTNVSLYTMKQILTLGYYDQSVNRVCVVVSEFANEHQVTINNLRYKFKGCKLESSDAINVNKIIKLTSSNNLKVCLPKESRILKLTNIVNVVREKFISIDDKICSYRYPIKTCYNVAADVNYMLITDIFETTKTLVHRINLINEAVSKMFVYEDKYYKNEIVCVHRTQVLFYTRINTAKYVITDGNKVCFIVEMMSASDKIDVGPINGCERKSIIVDPTTTRPNDSPITDRSTCANILSFESGYANPFKESNKATIKSCLEKSCYKIEYFFKLEEKTTNNAITRIQECSDQLSSCIDRFTNPYITFKILNPLNKLSKFIKTLDAIPALIQHENKLIFASQYYMDDVVCFPDGKLDGAKPETIFNLKSGTLSCSIIRELNEDVSVTVNVFEGLKRSIRLLHKTKSPYTEENEPGKQCSSIITDTNNKYHHVTGSLLWSCISFIFAQPEYMFDMSRTELETVSYTIVNCEVSKGSNPCINSQVENLLIKITSPAFDNWKIFHTKDLSQQIPSQAYYHSIYDSDDMICFSKDRVSNYADLELGDALIDGTQQICVINKFLSEDKSLTFTFVEGCTKSITLHHQKNPDQKKTALSEAELCRKIRINLPGQSQIITTEIEGMKKCSCDNCLSLSYHVKTDKTIQENSDNAIVCGLSDAQLKFYKITNQHIQKDFYIIHNEAYRSQLSLMGDSSFYKSEYYIDEIVCIKKDFLLSSQTQSVSGIVPMDDNKICVVVKDLTEDKTISIKITKECKMDIHLIKNPENSEDNSELAQKDKLCERFINGPSGSSTLIEISPTDLASCISHLCLKPVFVVRTPTSGNKIRSTVEYCEESANGCLNPASNYEYAKFKNVYNGRVFYVQASEKRKLTSFGSFHPSPFYKDEVVCFQEFELLETSYLNIQNSYSLDGGKCLLIGEITGTTEIQTINSAQCRRTLKISTMTSISAKTPREVDDRICRSLTDVIPDAKVISMTSKNLKNCLIHTCSKVSSRLEIQEIDKPFTSLKNSICAENLPLNKCIEDAKIYDFVKIQNTYVSGFKYFRNFDETKIDGYTQKRIVYYDINYYNDDAVCFFNSLFTSTTNPLPSQGVYRENDRTCFLLRELTLELTINYKITAQCPSTINLKKDDPPAERERESNKLEMLPQKCPEFMSKRVTDGQLNGYTKNILLSCIRDTCSKIQYYVSLTNVGDDYIAKDLQICTETQDATTCLTAVTHIDVIKIESPFIKGSLFLKTTGTKKSEPDFYKARFYKHEYYKNEVFCLHTNLFVSSNIPIHTDQMFINGDVKCYPPNELKENVIIQIRMFGKCARNIRLIHDVDRPTSLAEDECKPLYTTNAEPSAQMSLKTLKKCVVSTCSKILYFITDSDEKFKPIKKYHKCDSNYGYDTCLKDVENYFMVVIRNPSQSDLIYIRRDSDNVFTDDDFKKFYYKAEYFNDEVPCFLSTMIKTTIQDFTKLNIDNQNHICIIIDPSKEEKDIKLQIESSCERSLKFKTKTSRNEQEHSDDHKCQQFYNETEDTREVSFISTENLKSCIPFTCSKIVSYLEDTKTITGYSTGDFTLCNDVYGAHACINNAKTYDFVLITNPYRPPPFYLRTSNIDDIILKLNKLAFEKSIHHDKDIVCYPTSLIVNIDQIKSLATAINNNVQTCILTKELSTEIILTLNVTNNCHRTISIVKKVTTITNHLSKTNDDACSSFYSKTPPPPPENLIISTRDILLKCSAYTCSSFEAPRKVKFTCSSTSGAKCTETEDFKYVVVNSPYRATPFIVMTEMAKKEIQDLSKKVYKFKLIYGSDEIACFGSEIITDVTGRNIKYSSTDKKVVCYQFDGTESERVISINPKSAPELTYLGTHDSPTNPINIKKVKIEIFGNQQASDEIEMTFKYESAFDSTKPETTFSEFGDLEDCVVEASQEPVITVTGNNSIIENHGYAFTVSPNMILKNRFMFLVQRTGGCVGSFKNEINDQKSNLLIDGYKQIELKKYGCLHLDHDYLSISLNSKYNPKLLSPSDDDTCLNYEQLNDTCRYIHQYTEFIALCFKARKKSTSTKQKNIRLGSAIYVLLKHEKCYYHKLTVWQRVAFCKQKAEELMMSLFDWDLLQSQEKTGTVAATAKLSSGVSIGFGIMAWLVSIGYIIGRQSKSTKVLNPSA